MSDTAHRFRLRLFLVSGDVAQFQQSDADGIRRNVSALAPDSIFAQPFLIVAGDHRTTTYRTSSVLRAEIDTTHPIQWEFGRRVEECELLDEPEFQAEAKQRAQVVRGEQGVDASGKFDGLVQFQNVLGDLLFVRMRGVMPPSVARAHIMESVFGAPSFYARRGETHVLVNPVNLISSTMFPGPRELPYDAVLAHFGQPNSAL